MLATLDALKNALDIPTSDTSQDADLTTLLEAASVRVCDICGYKEADTTGIVEIVRNVQQGREVTTKFRALDPTTILIEGRGHGTSFFRLAWDVLDADNGIFLVLGSAEWWPPNFVEERRPRFRRWREPVWPVVRVTYDVTGIGTVSGDPAVSSAPAELVQGTIRLASFWKSLQNAGATEDAKVGQLSQTMVDQPIPKDLRSILGTHWRGSGVTARWVA